MHLALCDDDVDELARISALLEEYGRERGISISCEAFCSALDLLETVRKRTFDLLILDILMPGMTGMEAAGKIRRRDAQLPIVFLTSSREFAVESYRVKADDYILKPADRLEIFAVLDRQARKAYREETFILLKTSSGVLKLLLSQIVCVEVLNRTVRFTLTEGAVHEAYGYLAEYEKKLLADPAFFKPHRAYIVNLGWMTGLNKAGFTTVAGETIPVARDTFAKAKTAYMSYLLSGSAGGDLPC